MKFFIVPSLIILFSACTASVEENAKAQSIPLVEKMNRSSESNQLTDSVSNAVVESPKVVSEETSTKKGSPNKKNPSSPVTPNVPSNPVDVKPNPPVIETPPVPTYNFQAYEKYESLLKSAVSSSGKVNYVKLKSQADDLNAVVKEFQSNVPDNSWSYKQKLAYWINAYNVFTLKIVVDNYPIKSIKDIGGSSSTWDKKFIDLDGKKMSLNDIENGIIRKQFSEPRIHFAVNCASISCPKLYNRAFTASELESQLTKLAKEFLADNSKNTLDPNTPQISKLFDWYQDDFKAGGGVASFLSKYSSVEVSSTSKISYSDYNWSLND